MNTQIELTTIIPAECAGQRLDQVLAQQFKDYSRACLQRWVEQGYVRLNGKKIVINRYKVQGDEHIEIVAPQVVQTPLAAQDIALNLVYADEHLIVINKPRNLVVHPGAGNQDGTLVNALLHFDASLAALPRAGIVHRLDKDTSGLMVIARTLSAHQNLVQQLQARTMKREYFAIVKGVPTAGGRIEAPLGRHPKHRTQRAVMQNGKPAVTHYRIVKRFKHHTLLHVQLETGRTHQIRVHLAHINLPVLGDSVYGGRHTLPPGANPELRAVLQSWRCQALHAAHLTLTHVVSGESMRFSAPMPDDMENLLQILERA